LLMAAPPSQELEPPANTGRFTAPFLGKPEPEIAVTVYRGAEGLSVPLNCTPTNCIAPVSREKK
jgi:hypothetical protein